MCPTLCLILCPIFLILKNVKSLIYKVMNSLNTLDFVSDFVSHFVSHFVSDKYRREILKTSPNICTIDYQIFAINTVEKSCGFNHGEIKNKELTFLTLFYSVSNSKIVLDAIMLPNGASIFQVKLGTTRKIRVKIKLKRSIVTIFTYYILQIRGITRNFAIELQ